MPALSAWACHPLKFPGHLAHELDYPQKSGNSLTYLGWIPACAGMTELWIATRIYFITTLLYKDICNNCLIRLLHTRLPRVGWSRSVHCMGFISALASTVSYSCRLVCGSSLVTLSRP